MMEAKEVSNLSLPDKFFYEVKFEDLFKNFVF
jgi:hypothetical protein